ncbi:hypothetical protein JCM10908_000401 [Rhodotorula pacifica]|uniref:HIT family protein n=1 Tax=Rhodotorula pacifica TaxID=1495444 RepID=UPI00317351D5
MTSHFIDRFARRARDVTDARPPTSSDASAAPHYGDSTSTTQRQRIEQRELSGSRRGLLALAQVYEDDSCIAFFDIYPIRPAHTLLIPKAHYERVPHLPDDLSAHLGRIMPRFCRALGRAMEQPDMNIVSNQGYAQVVPHIHFHLVPAPRHTGRPPRRGGLAFLDREDLDDETADLLAQKIRDELEKEASGNTAEDSPSQSSGRGRL